MEVDVRYSHFFRDWTNRDVFCLKFHFTNLRVKWIPLHVEVTNPFYSVNNSNHTRSAVIKISVVEKILSANTNVLLGFGITRHFGSASVIV